MVDDIHFEVEDFEGRIIICEESRWNDHIDSSHHPMEGTEEEIIDAIKDPSYGIRHIDKEYPNRRIYYRWDVSGNYLTRVIVEFSNKDGEGKGIIITALQPTDVRKGDIPELK